MKAENPSRIIRIESIVLNCGALAEKLERSLRLLQLVSGEKPIKTLGKKRIPAFGIRPGLETGCKVTLRGKKATELLKRFLSAVNNELTLKQIGPGSLSFGIHEYIEIPGVEFQRNIGIMGFDISVRLARQGFSINKRKRLRARIPARHRISKEETLKFMEDNFNIKIKVKAKAKAKKK